MSWITLLTTIILGLLVLAIAFILAATLWPRTHPFELSGRTVDEYRAIEAANGVVFDQNSPLRPTHFDMDDGGCIAARIFGPEETSSLIVLVHGIGAAGERWNNPAGLMAQATGAQVVVVDLRGHGDSSGRHYDLEQIGQYENDLAQVIASLQSEHPGSRIWLAAHSMGGGIALRYALKTDRPRMAGYLLFAPVFGPGPTAPRVPPTDPVLRIDQLRLIGLILLNYAGIRSLNHLPVAYLNTPPDFPAYSFTAFVSGLPLPPLTARDGLGAMEGPVLIVAGDQDVAVYAEGFAELLAPHAHGRVEIVPNHGHDSFLNDRETYNLVALWMGHRE